MGSTPPVSKKKRHPWGCFSPSQDGYGSRLRYCVAGALPRRGTVHRTVPFIWVRLPLFPKRKDTLAGVFSFWSRIRESNPPSRLGKPLYYRYTNPASGEGIIPECNGKSNHFLSEESFFLFRPDRDCRKSAAAPFRRLRVISHRTTPSGSGCSTFCCNSSGSPGTPLPSHPARPPRRHRTPPPVLPAAGSVPLPSGSPGGG